MWSAARPEAAQVEASMFDFEMKPGRELVLGQIMLVDVWVERHMITMILVKERVKYLPSKAAEMGAAKR